MSTPKTTDQLAETLIIGGGPGGLATALGLARTRRQVVVFDSGKYRNGHVAHMHNVNTWDHAIPAAFRESARRELLEGRYSSVRFEQTAITDVRRSTDGVFETTDSRDQTWLGKTLVLATGVTDVMPELAGYKECWESGKIYHCLYCHGYEDSGCDSAGIIAAYGITSNAQPAAHIARLATQFAGRVVVYTNGSEDLAQQVEEMTKGSASVSVDTRPIETMVTESNAASEPGITLGSSSGTRDAPETVSHRFFVHTPNASPNVSFARSLGLEMAPTGSEVKAGPPFNATNVPGCYVVGDVGSPIKIVSLALSGGSLAAAGANMELS